VEPFKRVAAADLPKAWRKGAEIRKLDNNVTVSVHLKVPILLPQVRSPIDIGTTADTSNEDEALPARQDFTPTPTPTPEAQR
jgi:hypothetical protein